jgi:hypothetical protein
MKKFQNSKIAMSSQKNRNTHDRKCNAGTYEILYQVFLIQVILANLPAAARFEILGRVRTTV